jgi:TRAP-type mannitol/chloroaromatic compound transport system substrate-binding protein
VRKIVFLGMAVLLVSLLAIGGCAQPAAPATVTITATVTKTAAVEAPKVYKLNMQTQSPAGDVFWMNIERVSAMANEASGGRLQITPHVGGAVVPATKELEGVMDGSLDIATTDSSFHRSLLNAAGPFTTTMGGLTMMQQFLWYTRGDGDKLCAELYDPVDVQYVGFLSCNAPEIWLSSVDPVKTLADMDGYNMRVLGEAGDVLAKMGVNTVMLPGGEVYEATSRGTLDGFDYSSPTTNWNMGFQEVVNYMYMSPTRAPTSNAITLMRKDKWAELPDDLKLILQAAGRYWSGPYISEQIYGFATGLRNFKDYGTIVEPLPAVIDEEFMRLAAEYYDVQAAKDPFYAKVIASQREWKAICEELGVQ